MFTVHRRQTRGGLLSRFALYPALLALSLALGDGASGEPAAQATNMVTDISTAGAGDGLEVVIQTSKRPDASVFALSSPSRVVVDIDQTLAGKISAPVVVNKGPVSEISAREIREAEGTITRITILLNSVVDFTPEISDRGVTVRLKPKGAGAEGGAQEPFDDIAAELERLGGAPGSSETKAAPAEVVEEVMAPPSQGGAPAASKAPAQTSKPAQVASKPASAAGPVEITGVDFLPYEQKSRIRLTGSSALGYSVSPLSKDMQLVVDVPGASIPKHLQRPLDTSEFPSAVKMVSAWPLKDGQKGVRVAIKLREDVKYTVEEKGEQLFIDFPVPASISSKLPSNPSGDGSGTMVAQGAAPVASNSPKVLGQQNGQQNPDDGPDSGGLNGVMIGDTGSSGSRYSGRRISIDVREADLHNVFRMISSVSKLNIVAGDNVQGKVTVRLQNVPWDQALAVVLQSKGLGAVRFGNIVRIAPLNILKEEQEQRLSAQKAAADLEPLQTMILPLNFAIANDIKNQVEGALSSRGKLSMDTRTNALIVEDIPSSVAKARELATSLDTQTPQVLIEARIVEVSSTWLREFGIQWGGELNASANTGSPTGLYFPNAVQSMGGTTVEGESTIFESGVPNYVIDLPTSAAGASLALSFGSINDLINIDARLSAIESMGKGKVISSPKVVTVDNKESTISQGTRIPYSTVSAAGTSVQFIEALLRLTVTPHITGDGRVFLKVRVTNNRPDFSQNVAGQPAIEVKEASTEVMVKDGDTTVLGGVYTLNEFESEKGLPGLSKIPFLGWLFKNSTERSERKELLVFITPHVISQERIVQN